MEEYEVNHNETEEVNNTSKKKSGLATAGMVLGIISICISFIPIINNFSFILGLLALIFGIICLVKKVSFGKSLTGLLLGVISIIIAFCMQLLFLYLINTVFEDVNDNFNDTVTTQEDLVSTDMTEYILDNYLDLHIGEFEESEDGYTAELTVKVTNKGKERKSFSIKIEAIDENGDRIATDYIFTDDLAAGQSQEFRVFYAISSDKIDALKTARFRVIDVFMY